MDRKKITIEDVAQAAGVSRQTVSRAINDLGEISLQTRARVLRIAEEMGYRPSSIARGLATQRTHTLGLIVPDNANPFFSEIARGVEQVAYAEGYNVFLCNTEEDPQRELTVLYSLEEKRVDGIILCSSRLDDVELKTVIVRHSAAVLVNRRLESGGVRTVLVDDQAGSQEAVQHLLHSGHRAIGFLAGPPTSHSGRQRAEGYRAVLTAAGLSYHPNWTCSCLPTVQGGQESARELLTTHPELTALFCYNDLIAVGALQACANLGRRVPDDVAVAGFDDIALAALVTPSLTTCRVPRYELGMQAMRLLLAQVGDGSNGYTEILLRPELIVRDSAPG
ncbi:LacI family DNA-binding transcriptional regulator [Chloroflexota bacterium]